MILPSMLWILNVEQSSGLRGGVEPGQGQHHAENWLRVTFKKHAVRVPEVRGLVCHCLCSEKIGNNLNVQEKEINERSS